MNILDRIAARSDLSTRGTINQPLRTNLGDALVILQNNVCFWCRESFTETDRVTVDRLANGSDLGHCDCTTHCRHAYVGGNIVGAHFGCHNGPDSPRACLSAEAFARAVDAAPSAEDVDRARVLARTVQGRQVARDRHAATVAYWGA